MSGPILAVLLLSLATAHNGAFAAENEPSMLHTMLPGHYAIVGQMPDDGAAYAGSAQIRLNEGVLEITRTVGTQTVSASGTVEQAQIGEAEVVRLRWPGHSATCLHRPDLDNYSRLSCYWTPDGESPQKPGLEAYFPTANWPQPSGTEHASADTSREIMPGLQLTDDTGCYVSDGEFVTPTIVLMTGAYNRPALDNGQVLGIINTAIAAGCRIDETDEMGMSPLNAAILYNEPELVALFLQNGADPYLKISSAKPSIDQLNSFEFLELLSKSMPAIDRKAARRELLRYKEE